MATGAYEVNLVQPTDFLILDVLAEHGRNVAPNIALHADLNKGYVNTRLPDLLDYGLVRKVGPSERSGLYEITDKGRRALDHRDEYRVVDDFEALIAE